MPPLCERRNDAMGSVRLRTDEMDVCRYLAYKVLGFRMQESAAGHDSIEDSVTALRLYEYYEKLQESEEKSAWNTMLQRLYDDGRKDGFHVPERTS